MNHENERIESLKQQLKSTFGHSMTSARVIRSPYRICPLGAHIDHQKGVVTGMCIDRSIILTYAPNLKGEVRLRSRNFEGITHFSLDDELTLTNKHWSNYAKGATFALQQHSRLKYGIDGIIEGNLPIGGLSSSAAVGLAYLLALEDVNDLLIPPEKNIHLDQTIENEFIGLRNGILDQSTILLSQKNKLFYLDCQTENYQLFSAGPSMPDFEIVVVYSGICQALTGTGYNLRVSECQEAAKLLSQKANTNFTEELVLREVPVDVYEKYKNELPSIPGKRARHFFSEMERVEKGINLWQKGDLVEFGALINASGQSSIENYECGSPHLITIYRILSQLDGVYGARFSGAGFRGCCVGMIQPEYRESIIAKIKEEYPKTHVDIQDKYEIFICKSDEGAKLL